MDDVKENLSFFVLHVQMVRCFENFCEIILDYAISESLKKIKHELFTVELENA